MTQTHMFSFEYDRIFKNSYLEERLQTATSLSIWHINWKDLQIKVNFTPPKTFLFPYNKQWKKSTLPNILAVSAAGMFMDRETNSQPCFWGFLYQWSPENQVEYLSIFVGKGFNGKNWLLQNQFLFCAGQTCSHSFGKKCFNCSFVTDPWKKSGLFVQKTK